MDQIRIVAMRAVRRRGAETGALAKTAAPSTSLPSALLDARRSKALIRALGAPPNRDGGKYGQSIALAPASGYHRTFRKLDVAIATAAVAKTRLGHQVKLGRRR